MQFLIDEDLPHSTGDFDFSDVRNYPPAQYAGLIVLGVPRDATALFILKLLEGFLKQDKLVSELRGEISNY